MNLDSTALWILAGLILAIGEMVTSGFFLLFIALGCFGAALAASLGADHLIEGLVCALIAVVGVLVLRKPIQKKLLKEVILNADIGKEIHVDQDMPPHQQTRITYQGTLWLATNLDPHPLKQGERVVIVGVDGNILLIRKVN